MSRLPRIERSQLSADAQKVWDGIAAARGDVRGPYQILMNVPPLANAVGEVSRYLRFVGSLDHADVELAVLATAQLCGTHYVFVMHEPHARQAGVRPEAIDALSSSAAGFAFNEREQVIMDVVESLVRTQRLDDAIYDRALRLFGREDLIQLVALVGYYTLVGMLCGAFDYTMS